MKYDEWDSRFQNEDKLTAKRISAWLVVALAIIAAITAVGFIAGYSMQPFIVGYWVVLTAKNVVDYIGTR